MTSEIIPTKLQILAGIKITEIDRLCGKCNNLIHKGNKYVLEEKLFHNSDIPLHYPKCCKMIWTTLLT